MMNYALYGECPVCCDKYTDPSQAELYFCPCYYQVCAFCHEKLECCPNCRRPYTSDYRAQIENPLFHKTFEDLYDLRIINPRLARISPQIFAKDKEFDYFGEVLMIKQLQGATVILFRTEMQAMDCVYTLNRARIAGTEYIAAFGSTQFCRSYVHGELCNNESCPCIHQWVPTMKCFCKEDKSYITQAGSCTETGRINDFDSIPPSNAKIQDKLEEIKRLSEPLKTVIAGWASSFASK